MPEHPELLARLGTFHLHKTVPNYSKFVGETCEKDLEQCSCRFSLPDLFFHVFLTAVPEAQVQVPCL